MNRHIEDGMGFSAFAEQDVDMDVPDTALNRANSAIRKLVRTWPGGENVKPHTVSKSDVGVCLYLLIRTKHGNSQKGLADALGISESYLSDMLLGRRDYSDELLAAAGIERVTEYRLKK